jgi:polysaccharide pyruvyl transferase WcaK-like protein
MHVPMRYSTDTPLRILHLANHHSTNIGNGALISGLERTLREDLSIPVEFQPEPWDDYTIPGATRRFDQGFVDLCRRVDCLLVGAAVTLVGGAGHVHTGMRFGLPLELWDRIECPIVFYGLSYRTWPGQTYHHKEKLKAAIQYALRSDRCLFSVRNDGTKPWLSRLLNMDCRAIHEVPDPALYVETDEKAHPWHLHPEKVNIAISFNDEDQQERFATRFWRLATRCSANWRVAGGIVRRLPGRNRRRNAFIAQVADVLDKLAAKYPIHIVLCPHHHEDFRMIADFFERCSSRLKHQVVLANALPKADRASQFYNFYQHVDMTLAMRVHSMSPSIGLGVPTVALCSQSRLRAFMHDAGLEDYALDIFAAGFPDRLWRLCETILAEPAQARNQMRKAAAQMRGRTQAFNQLIERLLLRRANVCLAS